MNDLTLRHIQQDERERAANLIAGVFGDGDASRYNAIYHYYTALRPERPGMTNTQEWGAFLNGALVAYLHVDPYQLRYGRATLRVAGLGAVCTHPEHRQQGYAAALMREVLAYATEEGAHLALLNGIPHYYDRFGFMPVWPIYHFSVSAPEAAALSRPLRVRPVQPEDAEPMARLYEAQWSGRVAFRRTAAHWRWALWANAQTTFIAEAADGRLAGYLHMREVSPRGIAEAVASSREAVQTLLSFGGERWQQAGYQMMTWALPPDDYLIPHARQMLPVTLSARYAPSGGWMARLLDTTHLLETLLPEITAQVNSTAPDAIADALLLRLESDGVDLGLRGQPTTHCRLSLRDFIQVLFGSLSPTMLGIRQGLAPAQMHLLEALFPPRVAALAAWDWF